MTDLRTAAQQALEQLKINRTNFRKGPSKSISKMLAGGNDEAIADLESALAEYDKDRVKVEEMKANWALQRKLAKETQERGKQQREYEEQRLAALAEPEGGGNLPPPLQEPTVAENATTQQQLEDTPPSDYRRGYWDGFNIGKREGRIEAEDALAEPVQEPVAWLTPRTLDSYMRPDLGYETCSKSDYGAFPVYNSPPQQKPLTEEEIHDCWQQRHRDKTTERRLITRAIEQAHGIKE